MCFKILENMINTAGFKGLYDKCFRILEHERIDILRIKNVV